jgi:hypothetical protein
MFLSITENKFREYSKAKNSKETLYIYISNFKVSGKIQNKNIVTTVDKDNFASSSFSSELR